MFLVNVRDRNQLARVMRRLRHNHYVVRVVREVASAKKKQPLKQDEEL